jgi:hypothetical protein
MRLLRANHARRDRSEDENTFEAFAKNENADIEKCDRRTGMRLDRIRRAVGGKCLPNDHCNDRKCGYEKPGYYRYTPGR